MLLVKTGPIFENLGHGAGCKITPWDSRNLPKTYIRGDIYI